MWGDSCFSKSPTSPKDFQGLENEGREFLYPQLHHVIGFSFPIPTPAQIQNIYSSQIGVSQTCLGANVLSGLVPSMVFKKNLWAFLGPCVWGRGRPWYGTSAQIESHFTCSSPRGAPRVVPSTYLLNYFCTFLGALGRGEGAPLVRYLCKTQKSLHRKACLRNADRN